MKNKIIYIIVALIIAWGGLQSMFEAQGEPDNANFIVGIAVTVFEIGWYKFCWPKMEFDLLALFIGGAISLFGMSSMIFQNSLSIGGFATIIVGVWLCLWITEQ